MGLCLYGCVFTPAVIVLTDDRSKYCKFNTEHSVLIVIFLFIGMIFLLFLSKYNLSRVHRPTECCELCWVVPRYKQCHNWMNRCDMYCVRSPDSWCG
jgi:hypothetical protein